MRAELLAKYSALYEMSPELHIDGTVQTMFSGSFVQRLAAGQLTSVGNNMTVEQGRAPGQLPTGCNDLTSDSSATPTNVHSGLQNKKQVNFIAPELVCILEDSITRDSTFMPHHGPQLIRQEMSSHNCMIAYDLPTDAALHSLVKKLRRNRMA